MIITVSRNSAGVPVLGIQGNLTHDRLHFALRIWAHHLIQLGVRRVVVDLSGVERVDSAGIGELIWCCRRFAEVDGRLAFANPPRKVSVLFQRAGLELVEGDGSDAAGLPPLVRFNSRIFERRHATPPRSRSKSLLERVRRQRKKRRPNRHLAGYLPLLVLLLLGPALGAPGFEPGRPASEPSWSGGSPPLAGHPAQPRKKKQVKSAELRVIVRDYYHEQNLPPGLAKRDHLPPGLRRQLVERGQLPPGLQKRLRPLPAGLVQRLGRPPVGHGWFLIGADLILLDTRSDIVVRIVADVLG